MTNVTVREAREGDLPDVLALYGQPGMDDGDILPLDEAGHIWRRFARYPSYRLNVADRAGHVVGSYALLIMDNLAHRGAPSAIVEDVVVQPTEQGCGVGTAMMRHALEESAAHGCYKLTLSSSMKREHVHRFYDKLGFERHGFSFLVRPREILAREEATNA
jgi:GNAT superfamily N-acetyltransferase